MEGQVSEGMSNLWGVYADSKPVFRYSNRGQAGTIECTVVRRQDSSINVHTTCSIQCIEINLYCTVQKIKCIENNI